MKITILLSCLIFIISGIVVMAADDYIREYLGEGINPNQPLSVGDTIYSVVTSVKTTGVPFFYFIFSRSYVYTGIENNNIMVEAKKTEIEKGAADKKETTVLSLPLNNKKQALLKVDTLKDEDKRSTEELVITVVDEFSRIKVEKLNK